MWGPRRRRGGATARVETLLRLQERHEVVALAARDDLPTVVAVPAAALPSTARVQVDHPAALRWAVMGAAKVHAQA